MQGGKCSAESRQLGACAELPTFGRTHTKGEDVTLSTLVAFTTITTTLPSRDEDRPRLLRNVADRDKQLADHGRSGYRLLNTVTVTGAEFVTVIDTLSKDAD